ncbi:hypothetical protein [Ornithinimicrobium pratense]|uniref:Uncharacterized protein n=1 Tax=Ornithinimicrobium pratense TaxID=2593973 RepID=A0A5J6V4T7_9MICO|nr:hypothetical protein [Ornithinimicrobium pratense]QFG68186.1 hypothetical protein FY030_05170 [Ornithinimicrobium pratense]
MPPAPVRPRLLVNGNAAPSLHRDLTSVRVHVAVGQATAQVALAGPAEVGLFDLDDVVNTSLEIRLLQDEEFFAGWLTAVETKSGADVRTVLYAEGSAPETASSSPLPLSFGAEASGSVRRDADGWTAHCTCSQLALRMNSRIALTTQDPAFDGQLRVVEAWYTITAQEASVEFLAVDDRSA